MDGYLWIGEGLVKEGYVSSGVVAAASRRQALEATANNAFTSEPIAVAA